MAARRLLLTASVLLVLCAAAAANTGPGSGAEPRLPVNGGTTFFDAGDRLMTAQAATAAAIAKAAASGRAAAASAVGSKTALLSMGRNTGFKAFDTAASGQGDDGRRRLLDAAPRRQLRNTGPGSGSQPRRPVDGGTTYFDSGDRLMNALAATNAAIAKAADSGRAAAASAVGSKTAQLSMGRNTGGRAFDTAGAAADGGGRRRLRQSATNERSDRVVMAAAASSDAIARAVNAASVASRPSAKAALASAVSKGLAFARLAVSESSRPSDFDGN